MIFIFGIIFVLAIFLINCVLLKLSAKLVRISHVSVFECFLIFFFGIVLSVSLDRITDKLLEPSVETVLIYLVSYLVVNVGVIYWVLYGISVLRATALFFVYNLVIIALILIIPSFINISETPSDIKKKFENEVIKMLEPYNKGKTSNSEPSEIENNNAITSSDI